MLPFDNKSEFQIILNMPEGSSLERTTQRGRARDRRCGAQVEPEVRDYQVYAGTAAPFNFNGLVRHYFMRRGAQRGGPADQSRRQAPARAAQSHEIAKRIRPRVARR